MATWLDWEKESEIVDDLIAGLESALEKEDADLDPSGYGEIDIEGWDEDVVKTNKVVHWAIKNFDIPILHTWYRYGQFEPHSEFDPQYIQPKQLSEATYHPNEPSVPDRDYPSPKEFEGFFLEIDIGGIAEMDFHQFLYNNYKEFAPEEYRRLYLENLKILEVFDHINRKDTPEDHGQEYYEQFAEAANRIRSEITAESSFPFEVEEHIETSLHYYEDLFVKIAASDNLTDEQVKLVEDARELYHEYVWKWPALVISTNKAEGVNKKDFREQGREMLDELRPECKDEVDDFRDEMFAKDMIPSAREFRSVKSEPPEALQKLSEASLMAHE